MTKEVRRVSMWRDPNHPIYHPEPAKLSINDDYAIVRVWAGNWPDGLESDDVVGWPIHAHETTGDGLRCAYVGEIHGVRERAKMTGTRRDLQCKPAATPDS